MDNVKTGVLASQKPKTETVELIQIVESNGNKTETYYKITKGGLYVDKSFTTNEDQANAMYEVVLAHGSLIKETVLRSHKVQKGGQNG